MQVDDHFVQVNENCPENGSANFTSEEFKEPISLNSNFGPNRPSKDKKKKISKSS